MMYGLENLLLSYAQLLHPNPDSVVDGIGYGGGCTDHSGFANTLSPEWSGWFIALDGYRVNLWPPIALDMPF